MVLDQCGNCGGCLLATACNVEQTDASMRFRKMFEATGEVPSWRSRRGDLLHGRQLMAGLVILAIAALSAAVAIGRWHRPAPLPGTRELQMLNAHVDSEDGGS